MVEFSDSELGFIMMVMDKVDPTGLINEASAIRTKIRAYAEEKQKAQMDAAAVRDEADS